MSPRNRRLPLAALLVAAALVLGACGGSDDDAAAASSGHDHDAAVASVSGGQTDSPYSGVELSTPYQKPEFTLTDQNGDSYDFEQETGDRPTLLFFGYTNCPDVCPTTMADIAVALRTVDQAVAKDTNVVFVTTDPARDTSKALATWLGRFDGDLATSFVGLTGSQQQIDDAQLAAGVPQAEDGGQTHSAYLLLYGSDGEAHVLFDAANTPRDIAHDLALVAQG